MSKRLKNERNFVFCFYIYFKVVMTHSKLVYTDFGWIPTADHESYYYILDYLSVTSTKPLISTWMQ